MQVYSPVEKLIRADARRLAAAVSCPVGDGRHELPPVLLARLDALEAELDTIHTGWRSDDVKLRRFSHFDYDRMARTKWLLKWRSLLLHRDEGRSAPLADWTVIVVPGGSSKTACFAHAIPPDARPRHATTEPMPVSVSADVGPPPVAPTVSAPKLAAELRVPLEVVEAALAAMPPGRDPLAFCRSWARKEARHASP